MVNEKLLNECMGDEPVRLESLSVLFRRCVMADSRINMSSSTPARRPQQGLSGELRCSKLADLHAVHHSVKGWLILLQ